MKCLKCGYEVSEVSPHEYGRLGSGNRHPHFLDMKRNNQGCLVKVLGLFQPDNVTSEIRNESPPTRKAAFSLHSKRSAGIPKVFV